MKQFENAPISEETAKIRISRDLYVQVEERLNLRRALYLRHDRMTLQTMAQKALERDGENNG